VLVECLAFLAGAHSLAGHFPTMRRHAERALELAGQNGWTRSAGIVNAHLDLAWSAFLRAELALASTNIEQARAAVGGHVDGDVAVSLSAMELVLAAEHDDGTFDALRGLRSTMERFTHAPIAPAILAFAAPLVIRICFDLGEHGLARALATDLGGQVPDPGEAALLRAMLLHESGRHDAARGELGPVLDGHADCHVLTTDIRVRILAAELEGERGNSGRMHDLVCEGLQLAEPVEVIQPFLEAVRVRDHLETGRGRFGRLETFAGLVRAVASRQPLTRPSGPRLTPAEIAVLRELPSLLSLGEIATSRSLSLNTVKSHLRSIYRKLGVSSRREAVEAARRRNLL
jgi:LuxR family transcriptional regulator, maltose regulon positive regulatory protein